MGFTTAAVVVVAVPKAAVSRSLAPAWQQPVHGPTAELLLGLSTTLAWQHGCTLQSLLTQHHRPDTRRELTALKSSRM
jgi:hypothetical protein